MAIIIILPNLSPSPNLYKVQSVYNNNVASWSLREEPRDLAVNYASRLITQTTNSNESVHPDSIYII